jgi:hypothetical protein
MPKTISLHAWFFFYHEQQDQVRPRVKMPPPFDLWEVESASVDIPLQANRDQATVECITSSGGRFSFQNVPMSTLLTVIED